jgi:arylsulfatase A-like enzyme
MDRRTFASSLAAFTAAATCRGIAQTKDRPNILFALADDWSWPDASLENDPVVKTPTFDRVAREGVLFTNAYVAAPSCTPSRAAMLTGQYPWRLAEGMNLVGTLPARFPVYPDLLEKAGYHVGFSGKGWGPGNDTAGGRTRNPAGKEYKSYTEFMATRPKGAPFCFWFGSHDPHRPYDVDEGIRAGLDPKQVKVPPYLPDAEPVRKDILDYDFAVERYDADTGKILADLEARHELANTLVVMAGDNGWPFPRCKANLYDRGTHVPLAMMWKAHGAAAGKRVAEFVNLTELAQTFLDAAGLKPLPEMTGRSLLTLLRPGTREPNRSFVITGMERHMGARRGDLGYPMRAIRTNDWLYIRNFKPERWPAGDPNHPGVTEEELEDTASYAGFADIDGGRTKAYLVLHQNDPKVRPLFELATAKRPAQELYRISGPHADVYQFHNLAADPQFASILRDLDDQLTAQLRATADPRILGSGDEFDRYKVMQDGDFKAKHDAFFNDANHK